MGEGPRIKETVPSHLIRGVSGVMGKQADRLLWVVCQAGQTH